MSNLNLLEFCFLLREYFYSRVEHALSTRRALLLCGGPWNFSPNSWFWSLSNLHVRTEAGGCGVIGKPFPMVWFWRAVVPWLRWKDTPANWNVINREWLLCFPATWVILKNICLVSNRVTWVLLSNVVSTHLSWEIEDLLGFSLLPTWLFAQGECVSWHRELASAVASISFVNFSLQVS